MNEFTAKKLGAVLAFNRIGEDTVNKARPILSTALGEEALVDIADKFRMHGEAILRIATDAGLVDTSLSQSKHDEEKLKMMRKDYMADNFSNALEVFAWLGFFHGALIAHWALLRGIGAGLNHEGLLALSEEGVSWNYEMLESTESELGSRGQDQHP